MVLEFHLLKDCEMICCLRTRGFPTIRETLEDIKESL